ncbi:MAG: thioredoxin domain-containing protein [Candidatus Taylorbacteria bacterium]|nr:thioredoxin domain-containing protein [Candidatus Taylorbacteria bacterium]
MNTKRILSWGAFIVIIGLIVWGMIAAANKAERESAGIGPVDVVTSTDLVKGSASSTDILVEYGDFECPACGDYFPIVEQFFTENSSSFRFVYRHFPLTQHPNAIPAAVASEAAGMQGKFWEMYRELFTMQDSWATSTDPKAVFVGYATTLGLDVEKFSSDYELPEIKTKINDSVKSGLKAGVNSTPTFFFNGKKVSPQTYDQFKALLNTATSTNP